jgi:hypothetical protein
VTVDRESDEAEIDRIDDLASPLFDMLLEFEQAFCNRAIDELDITDADAETLAAYFASKFPDGTGSVFANLLRAIPMERIRRALFHRAQAVLESRGPSGPTMLRLDEINALYAKLQKGNA